MNDFPFANGPSMERYLKIYLQMERDIHEWVHQTTCKSALYDTMQDQYGEIFLPLQKLLD